MRHASLYYKGLFRVEEVEIPEKVKRKCDISGNTSPEQLQIVDFMDENSILCESISFSGQKYQTNDVIVLEATSRISLKVGLVRGIIYKDSTIYFLCHIYNAIRSEKYQFFETQNFDNRLYFVLADNIVDYRPLIHHGTVTRFTFPLHHYISIKM